MTSEITPPSNNICDGIDHGLPRDRVGPLTDEAYKFNQVLRANESGGTGTGNDQTVEKAAQAFYEELVQLPVGERKALLSMAEADNAIISKSDPAMPRIEATIDANAFLENLTIAYQLPFDLNGVSNPAKNKGEKAKEFTAEDFVFQGWGMCAETEPPGPYSSDFAPYPSPSLELPSLTHRQSEFLRKREFGQ